MKKLFVLLMSIALFFGFSVVNAQTTDQKIVVNASDLTPSQLLKIESDAKIQELEKKLSTYGKWVGVGGEIGVAVKEGLTAVVDVSDKFSKTDVGKFTMLMIAYKIMGKDFVRIVIGILFFIVYIAFLYKYYKTTFMTRKIETSNNGWKFWMPKTYEVVKPDTNWEGYQGVKWLTILMVLGGFGITYAIMFA